VQHLPSIIVKIVWLGAAMLVASFELALSEQLPGNTAET
jgi:hypothetical protein